MTTSSRPNAYTCPDMTKSKKPMSIAAGPFIMIALNFVAAFCCDSSRLSPAIQHRATGYKPGFRSPRAALCTHVGLRQMPVKGGRVELSEAVDLRDVAVQAVADGNVDESVVRAQGHSGLGTLLGQRVQASACTATKNDAEHGLQWIESDRSVHLRV